MTDRAALRSAHEKLHKAVAAQDSTSFALANAIARMKLLEADRAAAIGDENEEARERAAGFGAGDVGTIILTKASSRRREIDDQISSMQLTLTTLQDASDSAKQAVKDADASRETEIKHLLDAMTHGLIDKICEHEFAARRLRLEAKAMRSFPSALPLSELPEIWHSPSLIASELARTPVNIIQETHPLPRDDQDFYDGRKAAFRDFAHCLRRDPNAELEPEE